MADIQSVVISVKSDGIDQATKSLNNLVAASDKAEQSTSDLGKASVDLSSSQSDSASSIDKLISKYQQQVDLLGATVSQTNAYKASMQGASDIQVSMAQMLGAEVDAYRSLGAAQSAAIAYNNSLNSSYSSLQSQADAYYASEAKNAAAMQSLNDAGQRASDYAKIQDAQRALTQETNALAAAEANEKSIQQGRDYSTYVAGIKAYSDAQTEAIKINNQLATAEANEKSIQQGRDYQTYVTNAKAETAALAAQAKALADTAAAEAQAANAGKAFLNNLNDMVAKTTLSGQALKDYNAGLLTAQAAQLGVSDQASRMITSLQATGTAAEGAHTGIAGITRELIVVGHEAMTGNFSRIPGSFVVLAEKVNLSTAVVGGLTAATDALGISMTALLVGGAAIVAVLGVLAVAAVQANNDYKQFNNALLLSGNYAGTTASGLNQIALAATATGGSISDARKTIADLATTGKLTVDQISTIAPALVAIQHATGQSADGIQSSFEAIAKSAENTSNRSSDAVIRAVLEMNSQYHLLDAAQLSQVASLESVGKAEEAVGAAMTEMSAVLQTRSEEAAQAFTPLGKAIDDISHNAMTAWQNVKQLFATKMPDTASQISNLQTQRDSLTTVAPGTNGSFSQSDAVVQKVKEIDAQISALQTQQISSQNDAWLKGLQTQEANSQAYAALHVHNQIISGNSQMAAIQALNKFDTDFQSESQSQQLQDRAGYEAERLILVAATQDKVKALGLSGVNAQLQQIDQVAQAQIDADNVQLKSIQDLYNAKRITPTQFVDQSSVLVLDQVMAASTKYADSVSAVQTRLAMANTTTTEANELNGRVASLTTANDKAMASYNISIDKNNNLIGDLQQKAVDQQISQNTKVNDGIQKQIDALNAQAAAYNNLPDAVKAAGVSEKQMQDSVTAATVTALQTQVDAYDAMGLSITALQQAESDGIKQQIVLLGEKGQAQQAVESTQAANKAITDYNTKWKEANKQIGDDLASAIVDGGGKGWKKLITDMETAFAKVILQPILAPISAGLASLTTTVGASSPASVPGVGDASSAISAASAASSIYNVVSKGLTGAATTLGAAITGVGNFFGSAGLSSFGTGLTLTTEQAATAAAAYGPGAVASGLTSGALTGTIVTAAAGVAAGILGGNLISGQYGSKATTDVGTLAGAGIGTLVGGPLGTAIGAALGGVVGGITNRLFGMGSKNVTSTGIEGTLSTTGTTGDAYATWAQSGGLFRSDQSGIDKSALPDATVNSLNAGLSTLMTTADAAAKSLGLSTSSIDDFSTAFNIVLTGDTTKDTAAITTFLSGVSDTLATDLLPTIAQYAESGETASQTLQRMSDTFSATDAVAQMLGKDTSTAFGAVGLASAATRQALVDLAGGITTLQSETQYFSTNFQSSAEQIAPLQKAVTDAFTAMGVSGVTTAAQFDALVSSLDLSTTAGQEEFQNLMALAPAFKTVSDAMAKVVAQQHTEDEALLTAQGNAQGLLNAQRADEIAALALLDPSLVATQEQIYAITDATTAFTKAQKDTSTAFDVVSASITAAKNAATTLYNSQVTAINDQITAQTALNKVIDDLAPAVQGLLDNLMNVTVTLPSRASAESQIDNALTQAKQGNFVTADSLKDAISTLEKPSDGLYSSYTAYAEDQGVLAGKVDDLNTITGAAQTVDDQQLVTLNASLVTLKSSYDAQTAGFDQLLASAQLQLDAVNGTNVAIMSITDALNAFNSSVTAAISAAQGQAAAQGSTTPITTGQSSGLSATTADITADYTNILGRAPDAAGLAFWQAQAANGATATEIAQGISQSAEALSINGSHANGLDNVPFDGYTAKLHKGEMVLPASSANSVRSNGTNDDVVEAINSTMADLKASVDSQGSDINWLKKLFDRMSPNKNGLNTFAQTL